jgi:hypothetical protein
MTSSPFPLISHLWSGLDPHRPLHITANQTTIYFIKKNVPSLILLLLRCGRARCGSGYGSGHRHGRGAWILDVRRCGRMWSRCHATRDNIGQNVIEATNKTKKKKRVRVSTRQEEEHTLHTVFATSERERGTCSNIGRFILEGTQSNIDAAHYDTMPRAVGTSCSTFSLSSFYFVRQQHILSIRTLKYPSPYRVLLLS